VEALNLFVSAQMGRNKNVNDVAPVAAPSVVVVTPDKISRCSNSLFLPHTRSLCLLWDAHEGALLATDTLFLVTSDAGERLPGPDCFNKPIPKFYFCLINK
jgi:hypothetical protein